MSGHHGYNESFSRSRVAGATEPMSVNETEEPDLSWASQAQEEDIIAPSTSQTTPSGAPLIPAAPEKSHVQPQVQEVGDVNGWTTSTNDDWLNEGAEVAPSVASHSTARQDTSSEPATEPTSTINGSEFGKLHDIQKTVEQAVAPLSSEHASSPAEAPPPTSAEDTTSSHPEQDAGSSAADTLGVTVDPLPAMQAQAETPQHAIQELAAEPQLRETMESEEPVSSNPFGDTGDDTGDDWLEKSGIEKSKPDDGLNTTAAAIEGDVVADSRAAATAEPSFAGGNDLEDEWSKALGGESAGGDDAWAALGDELDADDFLEDEPSQPQKRETVARTQLYVPSAATLPTSSIPTATPTSSVPTPAYNPQPIAQQQASKDPSGKPMKFFEDLPMTAPRRAQRPKPQQVVSTPPPPPAASSMAAPPASGPPPGAPPKLSGPMRSVSQQYGSFVPPARLDPFPPQPSVPPPGAGSGQATSMPASTTAPPASSRYSPAVPPSQQAPTSNRYSAGPTSQPPPAAARYSPSKAQSNYAPQSTVLPQSVPTSSPLAPPPPPKPNARYSPAPTVSSSSSGPPPLVPSKSAPAPSTPPGSSAGVPTTHQFAPRTSSPLVHAHSVPAERSLATQDFDVTCGQPAGQTPTTTSPNSLQSPLGPVASTAPPRRSSTQSPEMYKSKYAPVGGPSMPKFTRSASVANVPYQERSQQSSVKATGHAADTPDEQYIKPQDASGADPLQRWKGSPVFTFGPSGTVVSMLPKAVPRYGGGQAVPMLKPTPGEVRIQKFSDLAISDPIFNAFPGPLKGSKSKKKELVAWMATRIEALQRESEAASMATLDPRVAERVLLWQVMKIMIDNDGLLAGNPAVDLAVRGIIAPETNMTGGFPTGPIAQSPLEPAAVQELTQHLQQGDREKAVWHAVDHKLWAHAMLIASTLNPSIWKQVVQEFVRSEVRKLRPGNQSMSALYNVFAQSPDEAVEELVPVSARAGFQMVSSQGSSQAQNVLDGLDRWRETLGLVLLNRSTDDEKALLSLGKLLAGYGRVEAAHVCYLFSRSCSLFAGADDAGSHFTVVGSSLTPSDRTPDLDSIILSEIYEYALTLSSKSQSKEIPHLQAYKLGHAYALIESGSRDKASLYCDSIASAVGSTTKRSPYYNPALASELQNLGRRLSQMPNESSSSWTSRPSMEKFTGKMWSSFNKFVAGDDTDAASNASSNAAEGEAGPFGRVPGGTPTISRSPSGVALHDMGQLHLQSAPMSISSGPNSRYAPSSTPAAAAQQRSAVYNPYQSLDSPSGNFGTSPAGSQYRPASAQSNHASQYSPMHQSTDGLGLSAAKESSYVPTAIPEESTDFTPLGDHSPALSSNDFGSNSYAPSPPMSPDREDPAKQSNGYAPGVNGYPPRSTSYTIPANSYEPSQSAFDEKSAPAYEPEASGYDPSSSYQPASSNSYAPPTSTYDPSAGGSYEPPASSYEPPATSYMPYEPEPDSPEDAPKPRRPMFGDEDDDGGAALKAADKARKDREADEAFRRAAEEDAKRDRETKDKRASGGWFGGLWGKKEANAPTVHRAKLGEENAFVFDPETKRWVNKKAGAEQTPVAAAAPPPPKAGPPLGVRGPSSGGAGMPPFGGPPSRAGTPADAGVPPGLAHIASGGAPTPPGPLGAGGPPGMASGPPSRPPTSMSNASSIDDLIGAPAARKGTAKKGKKGGRYVDVMAK